MRRILGYFMNEHIRPLIGREMGAASRRFAAGLAQGLSSRSRRRRLA